MPPKFLKKMQDVTTPQGRGSQFTVQLTATPAAVEWLKDGKVIKERKQVQLSEEKGGVHCMTIKDTVLSDQGKYECVATNKAGKVSCTARLYVQGTVCFFGVLSLN